MLTCSQQIQDLDDLRQYVNETLSHNHQLEPGAFAMTERILIRGGRPCGLFFCLHGPRSVKLTAIWENEGDTILFYDSAGERFGKTRLLASPCLQLAAA